MAIGKANKSRRKWALLVVVGALFIFTGVGCKGGDPEARTKAIPVTLEYWTVAADKGALNSIIQKYRITHPNVTIKVRVLDKKGYEQALLEAWAEDKGPDIFSIQNTWVGKYKSKIEPLPASTNLPYQVVSGTLKKETKWRLRKRFTYSQAQLEETFVPQVVEDAVVSGKILGLPLAFDTLALFYHKDIFNNKGIIEPPATWTAFKNAVKKITLLDQEDNIVQSAVAMGRADNVRYSVDIASLLMLQNGSTIVDAGGKAVFDQPLSSPAGKAYPAAQALIFYTDFANFVKEVYTWNKEFNDSLEAFVRGETAMFFGYAADIKEIQERAPGLNFGISPFPQIDGSPIRINIARYWFETVSKKSAYTEWAWDFLLFATSKDQAGQYVDQVGQPTALRSLLQKQIDTTPLLSPFNTQALTAKSWYYGRQPHAAYALFADMIGKVNEGFRSNINKLLEDTARKINQTL